MFERFTDRARRVVVLAQEEARMLNHDYIGTEHILLGLIHEGEGVAAKALEALGISLEAVRQQVEEIIGQGQQAPIFLAVPAPLRDQAVGGAHIAARSRIALVSWCCGPSTRSAAGIRCSSMARPSAILPAVR
jgi:hypothetical protein